VKGCLVVDENLFPVIFIDKPFVCVARREGGGTLVPYSDGVQGVT
jgi:hypothetical protein